MGILNKKERILDSIVTLAGRRRMGYGERFKPAFVSFSDNHTFYKHEDQKGVAGDATQRIYFEPVSRQEDSIIFETRDAGKTIGYRPNENQIITDNGGIIQYDASGSGDPTPLTGSDFASVAVGLLTGSFENMQNLNMIGSVPGKNRNRNYNFNLSEDVLNFFINNVTPFGTSPSNKVSNLDATQPLFYDDRLGHLPNFRFLPPVTKEGKPYGEYVDKSVKPIEGFSELESRIGTLPVDRLSKEDVTFYNKNKEKIDPLEEIRNVVKSSITTGKNSSIERFSVKFQNTNFSNNMISQIFEIKNSVDGQKDKVTKLDIIDFGEFYHEEDILRPRKHVFFAGKVFIDSNQIPCFINLFTLVYD